MASVRGRGLRRGQRGQSLVEFALILPVFILLLAGMIDFGMGLYSYMTIQNAAREGARLGVTDCTATDCASAVTSKAQAGAPGLAITVSVTCAKADGTAEACSSSTSGDSVTVGVSYNYAMIWPLTFGANIPMGTSVKMRLE